MGGNLRPTTVAENGLCPHVAGWFADQDRDLQSCHRQLRAQLGHSITFTMVTLARTMPI